MSVVENASVTVPEHKQTASEVIKWIKRKSHVNLILPKRCAEKFLPIMKLC